MEVNVSTLLRYLGRRILRDLSCKLIDQMTWQGLLLQRYLFGGLNVNQFEVRIKCRVFGAVQGDMMWAYWADLWSVSSTFMFQQFSTPIYIYIYLAISLFFSTAPASPASTVINKNVSLAPIAPTHFLKLSASSAVLNQLKNMAGMRSCFKNISKSKLINP